jgi:hypothetical protein
MDVESVPHLPRARTRPAMQNKSNASYVNAGNRCNFFRELPAGPAVVLPINGSVSAGGRQVLKNK